MSELKLDKGNWIKVRLGDIAEEPKESTKDILGDGFEHIVGLEHIESENIHLTQSFPADSETSFTKVFRKGDILFGRRRAYLKKAAQASFDGVCSGDITVIRAKKGKMIPELLPFLIQNDKFFDYAIKHSAGGLSPRVKYKDLANYEFLLPPKEEQSRLAELLWAMDEVIEKDKETLDCLYLSYNSTINEEIPKPSSFKQFKELFSFRKGVTYKSKYYSDEENGIPMLNLKSIARGGGFNVDGIKYYNGDYKENHLVKNEDLIIACTDITREGNVVGYPLKPSVYRDKEMLFTMDLIAIENDEKEVLRDYLYYVLKTNWAHWHLFGHSPGTTVLHLDSIGLEKLKIPTVKKTEQIELINKLQEMENNIDLLESKIASSQSLQRSLINEVF